MRHEAGYRETNANRDERGDDGYHRCEHRPKENPENDQGEDHSEPGAVRGLLRLRVLNRLAPQIYLKWAFCDACAVVIRRFTWAVVRF